ncbi:MAG TPA: HEAT repeat domain-containing protein [Elusimicrobiota bacterium]|nr:HEAT repeat domain-containing protein [Elusimicrobiota bacterium]
MRATFWGVALGIGLSLPSMAVAVDVAGLKDQLLSDNAAQQAEAVKVIDTLTYSEKRSLVDGLRRALRGNAAGAQRAAEALAHVGASAEPALGDLVEALRFDEETITAPVAAALLAIGPDAVSPLKSELDDSNFLVRRRAAEILGKFGPKAKPAAASLVLMLRDPEFQVHAAAEATLLQIGEPAIPYVAARLRKEDEGGRKILLRLLGKMGPAAVPALVDHLQQDPSPYIRSDAADALAEQGSLPRDAVEALIGALKDLDDGVRVSVTTALGQAGDSAQAALGPLLTVSDTDKDPLVRQRAHDAMERIGVPTPAAIPGLALAMREGDTAQREAIFSLLAGSHVSMTDAQALLVAGLRDSASSVRVKALEASAQIAGTGHDAFPIFRAALSDNDPAVRQAAIGALGQCSSAAPEAASILEAALKDSSAVARKQTVAALKQLGPAATPSLLLATRDENPVVADDAEAAIVSFGAGAVAALDKAAQGTDPVLQAKAAAIIKKIQNHPHHRHHSQRES